MLSLRLSASRLTALLAPLLLLSAAARAEVPYPTCSSVACADPQHYASYLFLAPGTLPDDYQGGDVWKYDPGTGMNVTGAWRISTGRPDVFSAILDSGIRWRDRDIARKVALHTGELPLPAGCAAYDCNGDGVVNVDDYAASGVVESNGNGFLDAQDLIRFYSDGVDDDGNGFVDDIAGWDFYADDNDPDDEVDYGHGTGEAHDGVGEANNAGGFPGVAPSSMFIPLRVADSFVAIDTDFALAVIYAVDRGAAVVSEALGTVTASPLGQQAIDYAYRRGVPLIASAADEESRHHNYPAAFEHTIWVNSIRDGDGDFVEATGDYTLLNGCTNFGGRAWVAISSTSCSSEATGRTGGLALLLVSHGRNLIDRGLLAPYPGLAAPFSAEEVRQILRASADDIDQSADLSLSAGSFGGLVGEILSAPALGLFFGSENFPTQAGWDQFTGYGRPDAARMLGVTAETIPPEADLSGSLRWFDTVDPVATPSVEVRGSAAAVRAGGAFSYRLEVGCGVQPTLFSLVQAGASAGRLEGAVLGTWLPQASADACGFDPSARIEDPDAHTVTLRLRVTDGRGNVGEDRRTVAIHHDPTLRFAAKHLGASGESSPALADLDRDGVLDIVYGASDGAVHALRGAGGAELPGFPVYTDPLPIHPSPAFDGGEAAIPHEPILASAAADDLDGDGSVEIVVASTEGKVYVFDAHGRRRAGFPVSTDPARSRPQDRDRFNDADPGISAAPALADLDAPGGDPALEIIVASWDGHVYVWRADGSPRDGFPVRLADPAKLDTDPVTGRSTPRPGSQAQSRLRKVVSSPAVGDLDGDGLPEIVVGTNEEYAGEPNGFALESALLRALQQVGGDLGDLSLDTGSRVYAIHHDGSRHAGGPFRSGWPARVPLLVRGLLPSVATGVPGAPALADLDGSGTLSVAIFGAAGPVSLLAPDGSPRLGTLGGAPRALATDFAGRGFPVVPASAGSPDAPFLGALGSGAFGDLTGDGLPEYVAPTGGLRALLDVALPARQEFGDHQITAWNPRTGVLLPAFPRFMDDMQFISSPGLADVDGDGVAEVVQGSGGYLVRAYRADGSVPAGWPKFTHGWLISSPTPGDVDGDGLIEIVATTREGNLYVWDTPAPASAAAIPWQGFGRDRRNTKNLSSGVSPLAAPSDFLDALRWALESIQIDLEARIAEAPPDVAKRLRRSLAPPALQLALFGLDVGNFELTAAALGFVDIGLRTPAQNAPLLTDLRERLVDALSAAVHRGLDGLQCAGGDKGCTRDRNRIQTSVLQGDQHALRDRFESAVRAWLRAFSLLARHLAPR